MRKLLICVAAIIVAAIIAALIAPEAFPVPDSGKALLRDTLIWMNEK